MLLLGVRSIMTVCLYSCLSYPACRAHAPYILAYMACLAVQYVSTLAHKWRDIREKRIEHKNSILTFFTNLKWEIDWLVLWVVRWRNAAVCNDRFLPSPRSEASQKCAVYSEICVNASTKLRIHFVQIPRNPGSLKCGLIFIQTCTP
jgi:hypothetical protein